MVTRSHPHKGRTNLQEARIRARNEAQILKASAETFSRKGFDGTRIADISRESGLPHANIHYYFKTKADIYRRLMDGLIAEWDHALEHISAEREPADAIAAYINEKFEHGYHHGSKIRLFAIEIMNGAPFLSKATRRHVQQETLRRAAIIDGWVADGKMRPVDSRNFLIMLWAATEIYSILDIIVADTLQRGKLSKRDYETAARAVTELVLNGICLG